MAENQRNLSGKLSEEELYLQLSDLAVAWRKEHSRGSYDLAHRIVQYYHEALAKLWALGSRGEELLPEMELPENLMPQYFIDWWKRSSNSRFESSPPKSPQHP
jgi:hypothetical protein